MQIDILSTGHAIKNVRGHEFIIGNSNIGNLVLSKTSHGDLIVSDVFLI